MELKFRIIVFLCSLFFLNFLLAETRFSDPKPTMDNPRKFIFPLSTANEKEISHLIGTTNRVIEAYGSNNCEVVIVCYADGIKTVQKDAVFVDKNITKRMKALLLLDVEILACNNTLKSRKIKPSELIDDVGIVEAGVVEIIERQVDGYIYVRP